MKFKNLATLLLAGTMSINCALNKQYNHTPYTKQEKMWLGASALGAAADVITTQQGLNQGLVEQNPIYGRNPSLESLIFGKLVFLGILYGLGEIDQKHRKTYYKIGTFCGFGPATWNYYQIEKNR